MSGERAVYDTGPTTVEAARALPEISPIELWNQPLGRSPICGDTICWFVDADGVSKRVVSVGDGWAKTVMI